LSDKSAYVNVEKRSSNGRNGIVNGEKYKGSDREMPCCCYKEEWMSSPHQLLNNQLNGGPTIQIACNGNTVTPFDYLI
jgi:hypothetical protein